jgi:hypothetical protein
LRRLFGLLFVVFVCSFGHILSYALSLALFDASIKSKILAKNPHFGFFYSALGRCASTRLISLRLLGALLQVAFLLAALGRCASTRLQILPGVFLHILLY